MIFRPDANWSARTLKSVLAILLVVSGLTFTPSLVNAKTQGNYGSGQGTNNAAGKNPTGSTTPLPSGTGAVNGNGLSMSACSLTLASPLSIALSRISTDAGYDTYTMNPTSNGRVVSKSRGFDTSCVDYNSFQIYYFDLGAYNTNWMLWWDATSQPSPAVYNFSTDAALTIDVGPKLIIPQYYGEAGFFSDMGLKLIFKYGDQTFVFIRGVTPTL